MKRIRSCDVPISDLALPADYEGAAASPKVEELTDSIRTHGLIQRVVVEQGTGELVCGRKRVAAFRRLGQAFIPADLVEFEDTEEKEIVVLRENLDRRELNAEERRQARARIIALEELRAQRTREAKDTARPVFGSPSEIDAEALVQRDVHLNATVAQNSKPAKSLNFAKRGRPSKGRSEAAKELGVSRRTVQYEAARAKAAVEPKDGAKDHEPPSPIALHGFGWRGAIDGVLAVVGQIKTADRLLRQAQAAITKIETDGLPMAASRIATLKDRLHEAASEVRRFSPASICLHCKRLPGHIEICKACLGDGYLVAYQVDHVPEKLRRTGDEAGIFVGGKFRLLSDLNDEQPE